MTRTFTLVVRRELLLALRRKGDVLNVLVFFVVVASLFPLGVGPEPNQLRVMAAGVAWIAALLAAVLSLPRLFAGDYADGTLEQMLVSPAPLAVVVLAKTVAHWLLTGLPLALVAPLIGLQYALPADAYVLLLPCWIGTPALEFIGGWARRSRSARCGGGALLGLPAAYVPVLVFGAGAVTASLTGSRRSATVAARRFLAVSSVVGPGLPARHSRRPDDVFPFASSGFFPSPETDSRFGALRPCRIAGLYVGFFVAPTDATGRVLPHHLHPRAGGLDVDVIYIVMAGWAALAGNEHAARA